MSFYIDTEPAKAGGDDAADDAAAAAAAAAFFLDTSRQSAPPQPQQESQAAAANGKKARKRRRETDAEIPPSLGGGEPKICYRSVSTGELGRLLDTKSANTSGTDAAVASAIEEAPRNRRPRFSRAVMNARFYDAVAAAGGADASAGEGVEAFRPGQLTDRLRSALGLAEDELPAHIYRMRELGYPPGWMLEARVTSSGVAIFDDTAASSSSLDFNGSSQEAEGEQPVKYDVSKLVKFPGFNCPLPPGARDQHARLGYPAMRLEDHLSAFIHCLAGRNQIQAVDAYHTRRMRMAARKREAEAADENEDDNLDDLEAQRLELLRQLEEDGELEELDSCSEKSSAADKDVVDVADLADVSTTSAASSAVVCTQFGSPVFSNYTARLPEPANFNRDIEQFRPFENLPNSTGGYAKVNQVVRRIRESLPKI